LPCGASMGEGYGPILVAKRKLQRQEIAGRRLAVPGTLTSAFLALQLWLERPARELDFVVVPFDQVFAAVASGQAEAGLVIHEGQLTYAAEGLQAVLDLGQWWKKAHGLPLPLGGNALLRSLPADIRSECCRMMRESIQYALEHHEEALEYALQFARNLDLRLADKFVGMYVNDFTVDCGELVPRAAQKLLDLGYEAGLISCKATVEFVR